MPSTKGTPKGNPRGSGYARAKDDWYAEPPRAVRALLAVEKFRGVVWDPSCGLGTIPRVFTAAGHDTVATDLVARGGGTGGVNFLTMDQPGNRGNIVSNPPYNVLNRYIVRALKVTTGTVALLLPLPRLAGARRRKVFCDTPFAHLWVFSSRIACPPGIKAALMTDAQRDAQQGAVDYAWFVWRHGHQGPATIGFLP